MDLNRIKTRWENLNESIEAHQLIQELVNEVEELTNKNNILILEEARLSDEIKRKIISESSMRSFVHKRENAIATDLLNMAESMIGNPAEDDLQKYVNRVREAYSLPKAA